MAAKDPVKRRRSLLIVAGICTLIALTWILLWLFMFSTRRSTDNAYVNGHQISISSQVPGTVTAILVGDTEYVKANQTLVRLDSTDADIRLLQARSALALAVRQVRRQIDTAASADAIVTMRKVELKQARTDLKRHLPLLAAQAEAAEIVQHLRDAVIQARAAVHTAEANARAAHSAITGHDVVHNPVVERARAQFRAAWVAAARNTIIAPVSGYVAQRSVQLGNNVVPGQQLMTILPLHHLWVEANFKENQLHHIRIGQPVKITTDLYGNNVVFHGKVAGLGAGTGSVFSLLPAQNATGNWIKVVQRVPVRITLNDHELDQHPLRLGLSAHVVVNIRHDHGAVLTKGPALPTAVTHVYEHIAARADAQARKIIHANLTTHVH